MDIISPFFHESERTPRPRCIINIKKKYNPPNDFRVLQRFWSKVNELNEISRRERVDFAFQKSAQFIGSELL